MREAQKGETASKPGTWVKKKIIDQKISCGLTLLVLNEVSEIVVDDAQPH